MSPSANKQFFLLDFHTNMIFFRYISEVVGTRLLPPSFKLTTPRVVMKMDIEGSEFELLPWLVMKGIACNIDYIFIETHTWLATSGQLETYNHARALFGKVPYCKVRVGELDDESYASDVDNTVNTC